MVASTVQMMVDRIVERVHPIRVVLFGSHARGQATVQSDVDLLVVLSQVADKRKAAVEIRRLLVDFLVAKDIVVTTPEEIQQRGDAPGSVLQSALRDGTVVYEQG